MNLKKLFKELKRRNVYKVALTYSITAWLLAQIIALASDAFGAPLWVMRMIIITLVIGFPIALILAWAFEMSPQGMIRTNSLDAEENPYTSLKKKPFTGNFIIAVLVFIVIAQFGYNKFWSEPKLTKSIVVLSLENISKNDSLGYFSAGLTNEIINQLAQIEAFEVKPYSLTSYYRGKDMPSSDIAKEVEAEYIITGTANLYGDKIKLSITLENQDNKMIWNHTYNEVLDDVMNIQLSIANQVAKELNVKLSNEEEEALRKVATVDGEAFKLFLKSKSEIATFTKEGISRGENLLNRAIELDPNYAQAYTLLAWSKVFNGLSTLGGRESTHQVVELVEPMIEKSMELEPNNSDIYIVRGNLNLYTKGLLRDAKQDVDKAIDLNTWPKIPIDYCICTVVGVYVSIGDYERAQELTELGRKVDPENVFLFFDQGTIHLVKGEMEKAQEAFKGAVRLMDIEAFNFNVGRSYYHNFQFEEALIYFDKAHNQNDVPMSMNVAYLSNTLFKLGELEKSELFRLELEERLKNGEFNMNLAMAILSTLNNESDDTLTWLEKSQENMESGFASTVNIDPIFKPYWNEPRFVEIRKKMQFYE